MAVTIENTKFSDIDLEFVKQYLRVDFEDDDIELTLYLEAGKTYVLEHSGKTVQQLDNIKYSVICLLKLVHDFYEQKGAVLNGVNLKSDPVLEMMMSKLRDYTLGEDII